jgi:hypothetical protein
MLETLLYNSMRGDLMNVAISIAVAFVVMIWYIRPIYNFTAKRKYILLDIDKMSFTQKVQTWLPSIMFYTLILGLMFYPAITNEVTSYITSGSILVSQVFAIFLFSRYDKWQTKYKVTTKELQFRRRVIKWDEPYTIKFKRNAFLILHKPRFILKSNDYTIVVPMLSHNIEHFITRLSFTNKKTGSYAREIYDNTRAYYVKNLDIEKELNKSSK